MSIHTMAIVSIIVKVFWFACCFALGHFVAASFFVKESGYHIFARWMVLVMLVVLIALYHGWNAYVRRWMAQV